MKIVVNARRAQMATYVKLESTGSFARQARNQRTELLHLSALTARSILSTLGKYQATANFAPLEHLDNIKLKGNAEHAHLVHTNPSKVRQTA